MNHFYWTAASRGRKREPDTNKGEYPNQSKNTTILRLLCYVSNSSQIYKTTEQLEAATNKLLPTIPARTQLSADNYIQRVL